MRTCKVCGNELHSPHPKQRTCGATCAMKFAQKRNAERARRLRENQQRLISQKNAATAK